MNYSTLKESLKYSPIETSAVAVIDVSTVTSENPSNILCSQSYQQGNLFFTASRAIDGNEKLITHEIVTAIKRHPDKVLLTVARSSSSTKPMLLEKDCVFDITENDRPLSLSLRAPATPCLDSGRVSWSLLVALMSILTSEFSLTRQEVINEVNGKEVKMEFSCEFPIVLPFIPFSLGKLRNKGARKYMT
jgi:hypothetical protein